MTTHRINHPTSSAKNLLATLRQIWTELSTSADEKAQQRQQAYLNEAVDIYDLEHRIRTLDKKSAQQPQWLSGSSI